MLVLTRKPKQSVVIGKGKFLTVTVLEISNQHVRLGFTADKRVPIMREELLLRLPVQTEDSTPLEGVTSQPVEEKVKNAQETKPYLH